MTEQISTSGDAGTFMTSSQLLAHWQGHRRLTRRIIEAFPGDKLFTYSIGGMRPFSDMVFEMLGMAIPGLKGIVTRKWEHGNFAPSSNVQTTADLLQLWDKTTEDINMLWPDIPEGRFQEMDTAFGQYKSLVYWTFLYFVENEIHHRGQAYVYLRSLGIEPPGFWLRDSPGCKNGAVQKNYNDEKT